MNINIYKIAKKSNDYYNDIENHFIKSASKYAKVTVFDIFNNKIHQAQVKGEKEAKAIYTQAYISKLNGYNVALDVLGKKIDSYEFSAIFKHQTTVNFFIGGAFGFEKEFLDKCDKVISLSDLTFAHKIASVVLVEQIFRGLAIENNHPYHK